SEHRRVAGRDDRESLVAGSQRLVPVLRCRQHVALGGQANAFERAREAGEDLLSERNRRRAGNAVDLDLVTGAGVGDRHIGLETCTTLTDGAPGYELSADLLRELARGD